MKRTITLLAVSCLLATSALAQNNESRRWKALRLGAGGIAEATDGVDLLEKLGTKYQDVEIKLSLVPSIKSGMPRQYMYPIYGTMYVDDGKDVNITFGNTSVLVKQYKPNGIGNVEGIAVQDLDVEWVVWVARARHAAKAAGIDGNPLDLAKAFGGRLGTSDQERETKQAAIDTFVEGLKSRGLTSDDGVSEGLISQFGDAVELMDDGTGILTIRNASEGREIGNRALELLDTTRENMGMAGEGGTGGTYGQ